ncbi:MAG: Fe-S cluster assembly ATPase SufC [Verrucomicrobia bacterium]|nr:Fe-S cluster assembly ATPase SufC [Verrucomicrobiota bacterium]
MLFIEDLYVTIDDKPILKGLSLKVKAGEIHALMGPNGAGKSTLAKVLAGHPDCEITSGKIWLDGVDITEMDPEERAQLGLFMSFQYPLEIAGVTNFQFLHAAYQAVKKIKISEEEFTKILDAKIKLLEMKEEFKTRFLNEGFSGGEKKRNEILQMAVLEPKMAILDETDSGLDIDAIRIVSSGVLRLLSPERGLLLITHYQRLLDYIKPHFVHVVLDGRIVESGGPELAKTLEEHGYAHVN